MTFPHPRLLSLAALAAVVLFSAPLRAETLVENSLETQFQIDLKVPDAALAKFIPAGWTVNVSAQGPAKDCNVRLIFVDRLSINDPDGRPLGKGSHRVAHLVVPVRDPSGATAQMVIAGLTDDATNAPGPFGAYLLANRSHFSRTVEGGNSGPVIERQDWSFAALTGEHLEMHIVFERGVANKNTPSDVRYYSAKNPNFYQISRQERVLEILRNVTTTPPDRVREFSLGGGGGSIAGLFDGTEQVLSWDNLLWVRRTVLVP